MAAIQAGVGGKLADRRQKKLAVLTNRDENGKVKTAKRIERVDNSFFQTNYQLGKVVQPSTHHDMEIRFARRKEDGRDVVVKLRYKPHCFATRQEEADWRQSTEFMLNLPRSAGVAQLFEVLEDDQAFYIVTERAQGVDLFELLLQDKQFPVASSKQIVFQLLEAMDHLHKNDAIHKDLKLENIVVQKDPGSGDEWSPTSVKVVDFDTVEEWSPKSPGAKDVLGTDQYIAQEAYAGKYSPYSDIFALGVIAYRLLAGKFPFRDETFDDKPGENWVGSPKMKQIQLRLRVSKINFELPAFRENPQATDLIRRMLAVNELDRPTAEQALAHEWFNRDRSPPGSPKMMPRDNPQGPPASPKSRGWLGSLVMRPMSPSGGRSCC